MPGNNGEQNKQAGLSWTAPQTPSKTTPPPATPSTPKPPLGPTSSAPKYIGMIVVGVIAGIVLAWGWSSWRSGGDAGLAATSTVRQTSTSTAAGNLGLSTTTMSSSLVIANQPAGGSVKVEKAVVSVPTWVVIYENKDGKPGNALGATLFFPQKQSGTVELLRSTAAGKSYLATRQVDNGDRKFSLKGDAFLEEGAGVEWVTFETQ